MKDDVRDLYKKLSENIGEAPELFHYDYFKLEGGELYYKGSRKPLTTEGKLKVDLHVKMSCPRDRAAMEKAPFQSPTDKKHTKTTMQVGFVGEHSQTDLAT